MSDSVLQLLLLSLLCGAGYSYFAYPLLLLCLPARRRPPGAAAHFAPRVSLIITCHNESDRLPGKITNSLALRYRPLEIIIASDASDDGTDDIARSQIHHGVRLVRSEERRGKEYAQGLATQAASGDVLVFSDVGTSLAPDTVEHIVSALSDPAVGAVSSVDRFVSADGRPVGEGLYVQYEMWLRKLESRVGSLVGLSGSLFAIRRALADDWDDQVPSDFACAFSARRHGLAAVADPRVIGTYQDVRGAGLEYQRKVRTALRGMAAIARNADLLNPVRHGLFAFELWSHKILRWAVPWFLAGAFAINLVLAVRGRYVWLMGAQTAAYLVALACHGSARLRELAPLRVVYYFVQVNIALAQAAIQFLMGRRITSWQPSQR